jgi:hypothetical protein
MITRIDHTRGLAALAAAMLLTAATLSAQTAPMNGPGWDAWLGCWQAAAPGALATPASLPLVCVSRAGASQAVEISTTQDHKVLARDTIVADGVEHPITAKGCTGWKSAQWSNDARRVYLRSEVACNGNIKETNTGILAIAPAGEWLDVQSVAASV